MALTFNQVSDKGLNTWGALKKGNLITSFDYDMREAPEILKGVVESYSDPLIQQFIYEAGVGRGTFASDQVRWYEHGRIQNSYPNNVTAAAWSNGEASLDFSASTHFDIKAGQTLMVGAATGSALLEVRVKSIDASAKTAVVESREATPTDITGTVSVIHVGSEYPQGSDIANETVTRYGTWRKNNPIILRDNISYDRSKLKQMLLFSDDLSTYMIDDKAFEKVWEIAQIMTGIFGKSSETGSKLQVEGLAGSESVEEIIKKRGNSATGTWANKADLENYVKLMNSNRSAKTNMLLLNIDSVFDFDDALAGLSPNATNEYNWGNFNEGVDMRKVGFSGVNLMGYDIAYKAWDILDDETYLGVFSGNSAAMKGISIPKGKVQMADGSTIPYLQFLYRGNPKVVAATGTLVGNDHVDEFRQSYTTEMVVRLASAKDFIAFY